MQFVPYRDLRNEPAALRKKLEAEGELVVTVDGKPFAMMIDLAGKENIEEMVLMMSRIKAQLAARAIRSQAKRDELSTMTGKQVDALIAQTRKECRT